MPLRANSLISVRPNPMALFKTEYVEQTCGEHQWVVGVDRQFQSGAGQDPDCVIFRRQISPLSHVCGPDFVRG